MTPPSSAPSLLENPADTATGISRELAKIGPALVLLIGTAASGKTQLADALATSPYQVLSLDELRASVSDNPADQTATQDAVALLHQHAAARLKRACMTFIDATNVEAAARWPLLRLAREHRIPAAAIVMLTPLPLCIQRNGKRPGPARCARWGRRVPLKAIERQHGQLLEAITVLHTEGFARVLTYAADDPRGR